MQRTVDFNQSTRRRLDQFVNDVIWTMEVACLAANVDASINDVWWGEEGSASSPEPTIDFVDVVDRDREMRLARIPDFSLEVSSHRDEVLNKFEVMCREAAKLAGDCQLSDFDPRVWVTHQSAGVGIVLHLPVHELEVKQATVEIDAGVEIGDGEAEMPDAKDLHCFS